MNALTFALITFGASVAAGLVGSLLGLGGGIIVVPVLTQLLGVDIRYAIGASIVAVIATSSASAAAYVRDHLANLRLGMVLEVATVAGGVSGAVASGWVSRPWLSILFGLVMGYAALAMLRSRRRPGSAPAVVPADPLADRLALHSAYHDPATGQTVSYRVTRTRLGLAFSYLAGVISGLLGVGGGIIKVPTMHLAMRLPLKASTATSNFTIGVTAAAGASVWFARGEVEPLVVGPVAAGVLLGATLGAWLMPRLHTGVIRWLFLTLLLIMMVRMIHGGWRDLRKDQPPRSPDSHTSLLAPAAPRDAACPTIGPATRGIYLVAAPAPLT